MTARAFVFETERLRAARWLPSDAEAALTIYGDPLVTRYIGGRTWPDLEAAKAGIEGYIRCYTEWGAQLGGFPLFRRSDDALVGAALVKFLPGLDRTAPPTGDLEIGWHLARRYQGMGFATEAGRAVIAYALEHHPVDVVHAVIEPENVASIAVAERLGMTHLGQSSAYYGGLLVETFVIERSPR